MNDTEDNWGDPNAELLDLDSKCISFVSVENNEIIEKHRIRYACALGMFKFHCFSIIVLLTPRNIKEDKKP
jgi:hypothetical protein